MRLVVRKMRPEDRDFVIGTWLHSYRRAPAAGLIAMDDWQAVMSPQLGKILDRPRVHVLVVADGDRGGAELADLFGHLVFEDLVGQPLPLVYFAYVKHAYRRSGLARSLMRAAGIDPTSAFPYVCETKAVQYLREAGKLPRARWCPLLGRQPNQPNQEREHERREQEAG